MGVELPFVVPTEFASLSGTDLAELRAKAREATATYADMDVSEVTPDDIKNMKTLTKLVKDIDAQLQHRNDAAGTFSALSDALGEESDESEEDDVEVEETSPETEEPPAPPAAKPAKKKTPSVAEVVAAGGGTKTDAVPESAPAPRKATLLAGAHVPGHAGGAELSWLDIGKVVEKRFLAYGATGQAGPGQRDAVAQIKIEYPAELTAAGGQHEDASAVIEYASSEKRLPGGSLLKSIELAEKGQNSLTAAGTGWCAPSQVVYDLYELESNDGLLDLPEINVTRGGIKFTTGPDFSSIFSGAGYFHMTEAQIIAGTTKPTMPVPCPSFTDVRLDADGLAIQADLLQLRGYPELIARFVRGAMIAHNHKINQFMINALVTGSTVMPLPSNVASHTPGLGTTWATDHSVVSTLLSAVDLAITDYKYRQRMRMGATLEVVFPYWLQSLIRADVQRRTFYDGDDGVDQFAVTMANINHWLAVRGARAQWIYDWQDAFYWAAFPSGAPAAIQQMGGSPTTTDYVQDWPHAVQFLVYAAGTWTRGNADIITLDTVYDSTLLSANKVTQLFTEQGILAAKTGFDSRLYSISNIIPTGSGTYAPIALAAATSTQVLFPSNP